jgi:uncharacterized protein
MKSADVHIPSEEVCRRIISEMGVLDNIVAHCLQVRRVSLLLADHLGLEKPNRDLIRAAALLHDITKTRSFQTREDHAATGALLLKELGYPEVGVIVGQHVRLNRYCFVAGVPAEAEIVNYADKRVLHDKIVPLKERMGYILEKYGTSPEIKRNILLLWDKTEKLEQRLFVHLPFAPCDLSGMIAADVPLRDGAHSGKGRP